MTVPGTFKNRPPMPRRDLSPQGREAEALIEAIGALTAERWLVGDCTVMIAREPIHGTGYRWHLSIAHPDRYPTWDEIKTAVYGIEALAEVVMAQVLGPVSDLGDWVNVHDNCFHLYEIHDEVFAQNEIISRARRTLA